VKIIIPTKGRVGKQTTFSYLPAELRKRTVIVCPEKEVNSHRMNHPQAEEVLAQPDPSWKIYRKRRWLVDMLSAERKVEKIVMLDDDLRFCIRRDDNPERFAEITPEQMVQGFKELENILSPEIPHAGFSARGGNLSPAAQRGGWQEAKRMMCVLGYHLPTVLANCDPFRIETREDMDTCLQLLRKGFPNAVSYTYHFDQKFGAPGGASSERDFTRANKDAHTLARYHPGFVKVIQKDDSGRQGLSEEARTRLEVVVQWVKAFQEGQQWRASQSGGAKDGKKRARKR